jgi:Protein of unknown function (DUF2865)
MVVVRRRLTLVCHRLSASSGKPRPWRIAALGVACLAQALAGGEAAAQIACARCGAAPPALVPPASPQPSVDRSRRRTARREAQPKRKLAMAVGWAGGSYTVCVRACDGSFFPVSYVGAANRSDTLEQVCRSLCPNTDVALYSFPFGGTIDEAVSSTGEPYALLPNANKFVQSYDPSCSCRAPGQSWAKALASAEAKYGHGSRDIRVTPEKSAEMARPIQDPKMKSGRPELMEASDTTKVETGGPPPLDLDPNGVDTGLKAAASKIGHESSALKILTRKGPRILA